MACPRHIILPLRSILAWLGVAWCYHYVGPTFLSCLAVVYAVIHLGGESHWYMYMKSGLWCASGDNYNNMIIGKGGMPCWRTWWVVPFMPLLGPELLLSWSKFIHANHTLGIWGPSWSSTLPPIDQESHCSGFPIAMCVEKEKRKDEMWLWWFI